MTKAHEELLQEFRGYATTAPNVQSVMERIAKWLHEKMPRHNWAGFYLIDPTDPNFLIVGPFVGSFTPNTSLICFVDNKAFRVAATAKLGNFAALGLTSPD
jgi:putative methionine-R-sulfoxide reductase with GAF domain